MSKISEIKKNTIILSVEYSFHKEKLQEITIKQKLESIFTELLKTKTSLEFIETPNGQKQPSDNNQLNELATALGGEVVN